ncbi:transposase [Enterococcus sp. DIV0213h]|uniref:transposase n=1 Tax=Enterococcus sp. DIV0213h TaxID=2774669 RepID=UPI003F20D3C4
MPRYSFYTTVKIATVKLVKEAGFSVKEVILQLEVYANSLYRWVQEVESMEKMRSLEKGTHFLMPIMK